MFYNLLFINQCILYNKKTIYMKLKLDELIRKLKIFIDTRKNHFFK